MKFGKIAAAATLVAIVEFVTPSYVFAQSSSIDSLTANGQSLGSGASGGAAAGGGDLFIDLECYGGGWADTIDDPVYINIQIFVEGQMVANQSAFGWGYVDGGVGPTVRASTQDRSVECDLSAAPYGEAVATGTLLGSGPGSATLQIAAFIRQNWVLNPANIFRIFGGDDRGFSAYGGTSRFQTNYDVYNPAVNDEDVLFGPLHSPGLTQEYEVSTSLDNIPPFGRLTADALNDWVWDVPMKTRWQTSDISGMDCSPPQRLGPSDATSSHQIHCTANVSDPLVWLAPGVKWDLTITLTYGLDNIHYAVSGCHSYFPAFEAYANGAPLFQDAGSDNPSDLLYGCGASVSVSGDIQ
jgi:hypothetical protein